ncbi:WXG100 family type VII secretion target [Brotaphodocola sp.]|uniref:WXG100 family type VII secretion target n=1 Tax=Brotaphodocola sp. TaxID=3073577 RepID=UPI003D7EE433
MEITVTPEELLRKAEELESFVNNINHSIEIIEDNIHCTSSFWKGNANEKFISCYNKKRQNVIEILQELKNSEIKLRQMSGTYTKAEKESEKIIEVLQGDIL